MSRLLITLIATLLCIGNVFASTEADRRNSRQIERTFEHSKKGLFDFCRQSRDCNVVYIGEAMIQSLAKNFAMGVDMSGKKIKKDALGKLLSVEMIQSSNPDINEYIMNTALDIFSEKKGYKMLSYNDDTRNGDFTAIMQKQLGRKKYEIVVISQKKSKKDFSLCILTSGNSFTQIIEDIL